ncbi:hypothetical protein XI09_05200 [Bradyrhizobium sp. CCBAU 11386]|uniref:hypothetical protein n=1 Tax=Bradyrhizobium sp. CCBAU 11386 TaxID=1630837 RepID=UPI0023044348|nr:hypothetical protein [Bradyrhizobium sp. CCBAU 11386]MDA9504169.1 hypothetical protein [Bradyrhizobium sp. CCBAU 11386]
MIHPDSGPLARLVLPASGLSVTLRHPTGLDDILIAEGGLSEVQLALAIAERLGDEREALDWTALPVCDLEALLLHLRRGVIGDQVVTDSLCSAKGCGARLDFSFSIDAWLAHHRPKRPPLGARGFSVRASERHGEYDLSLRDVAGSFAFRIPTIGDQIAAAQDADAEMAIAQACLYPPDMPPRARRAAERAMQFLAPGLRDNLQGVCPECRATITVLFDPLHYCLQELRDRARYVYQDVDILAQRYAWSEAAILTIPSVRRMQYAELARATRVA